MKNRNKLIACIFCIASALWINPLQSQSAVTSMSVTNLTNEELGLVDYRSLLKEEKFYKLKGNSTIKSHLFIWSLKGKLLKKEILPPFTNSIKIYINDLPTGDAIVEWWTGDERKVETIKID